MSRPACSIEGCEKESRGRGLCATHWSRWRKHGDPMVVRKRGVDFDVRATCTIEDCDRPAHGRGFCATHYTRWFQHGDPLHVEPLSGRPRVETPGWGAVHARLTADRGKARQFSCVDCGGQAAEWSYDNADPDELIGKVGSCMLRYSLDPSHYVPRCAPCHRRFDMAAAS